MKSEINYDLMCPELQLDNNDPQALARLEKPDFLALKRSFSRPGELHYPPENLMELHQHQHHRIRIAYYNDAVRERSQANAQQLLLLVATANNQSDENHSDEHESNSAILARKALRYRKIYDRMDGVDVTDPRFNASQFLGVTWHKLVP